VKYSVGYRLSDTDEESFISILKRYKNHLKEVYFPWPGIVSGRGLLGEQDGYTDWNTKDKLVSDLKIIKEMGLKLDLLMNGNCYAEDSMSVRLENKIHSVLSYLESEDCSIDVVTTTSPAIAHMVKKISPDTEIRASVNMKIGTVKAMEYLSHLFDSFYICRDFNRDLKRIEILKQWADANNKKLYMLANSGCMRECSFQTFHDNLVAHNEEIHSRKNIEGFMPYACWNFIKNPENRVSVLQNTWIRPEDIRNFEPYFDMMKLATRIHERPAMVIDAYSREKYYGNLLDLFEPGFGPAFAPYVLDNSKFPEDWFEKTMSCDKQCQNCSYCRSVLEKIMVEG